MLKLDFSYDLNVESAYIITLKGNATSESMSKQCQDSCKRINMPYKVWDAYDGTSGTMIVPEHSKNSKHMSWFKQMDPELSMSEVACVLSHASLWCRCIEIDKPIVILEHDAIMVKPFTYHMLYNSIIYLGCHEQYTKRFSVSHTAIHGSESNNYHFILRTHAYAIDPCIAKTLVSHLLSHGIHESADHIIRADLFPISQFDVFAFDNPNIAQTTITGRKKNIYGEER